MSNKRPADGEVVRFSAAFADISRGVRKIKQKDYLPDGNHPIIDQGQGLIAGYSNEDAGLCTDVPAIVFGDHTRCVKYVDEPFFAGADGVKILKPKLSNNVRYWFHALRNTPLENLGYSRHFKLLKQAFYFNRGIEAQAAIAGTLDSIERLESSCDARCSKLDELVKSRFVEMFGDLEHNEAGWPVLKFDDFAIIDTRMTNDFAVIANVPHIGIDSIESNTGKITDYRTVAEDGVKSGKYLFTSKHIIYSKIRPALNKVALPTFSGVCSADAYPILPVERICDRYFLAYVMRSHCFLKYILPLSGRAQMPKVNKDAIRNFTCPFPPLALQRQFADFVTHVDKLRTETQRQKQDLQTLYDSLAQEYFAM